MNESRSSHCGHSTGAGIGTVNVRLTNASLAGPMAAALVTSGPESPIPPGYVKSVDIFVVRIDAKAKEPTDVEAAQATEESESSREGWVTIAEPNTTFDLVQLTNGTNTLLGDAQVFGGKGNKGTGNGEPGTEALYRDGEEPSLRSGWQSPMSFRA